jgi:hypothetical protein
MSGLMGNQSKKIYGLANGIGSRIKDQIIFLFSTNLKYHCLTVECIYNKVDHCIVCKKRIERCK